MAKHYGNLEVYGFVTVGKNTSGEYTFPLFIGNEGEILRVEDGELVFASPSTIDMSEISGGQNALDNIDYLLSSVVSLSAQDIEINNDIDYLLSSIVSLSAQDVEITDDIFADLDVGAIEAGETVSEGTTFQEFAEKLLKTTFFPTFTAPSFTLGRSGSSQYEIGEILNITLTGNFNRGSINGDLDSGVWNPSLSQGFRAGAANLYTIDGTLNGTSNSLIVSSYQIVSGNQNWSATVAYDSGPQPLDSKGNNYNSPLSAGSLSANSSNIAGRRRSFWGTVEDTTVFTTSAEVRALASSQLNLSNGSTFTINIPIGAEQVIFAYPATLNDVDSVKHVEGLNAEVKGTFTLTTIVVDSANSYDSISYKVYYYIPVEAFADTATYTVTI